MSAVRMCDGCGDIFSERADGWATMSGTRMTRDPQTGKTRTITENLDYCDKCTTTPVTRPRLALDSATGVDRIAKTQTNADRETLLGYRLD